MKNAVKTGACLRNDIPINLKNIMQVKTFSKHFKHSIFTDSFMLGYISTNEIKLN